MVFVGTIVMVHGYDCHGTVVRLSWYSGTIVMVQWYDCHGTVVQLAGVQWCNSADAVVYMCMQYNEIFFSVESLHTNMMT